MKFFFDTEFIEDGKTIDLISIGIVAENGREFYAESDDVNWFKANQWVLDNVRPHLWSGNDGMLEVRQSWGGVGGLMTRTKIASAILRFIGDEKPEFWAYYADYDWVVLCQLYGTMMDLPDGWPMFCMDLKQLCVEKGNPELPKQDAKEHHALYDALWVKESYEALTKYGWAS